jgi:phage terminase large subunit
MGIKLPTFYVPRDYQLKAFNDAVNGGHDRHLWLWPRRAGKDLTAMNVVAMWALTKRVGNYYYFLPTYSQGEKIIWDGRTKDGHHFLDVFPPETIAHVDNRKMKIKFTNGSLFQVVGASEADNVVGTNPVGCVFSEYSIQDPRFWDYISPILVENGGWAIFTYTARGLNHGWRLYEQNKDNSDWFVELRTCETVIHNGQRVITEDILNRERRAGKSEDFLRQEYYNDFLASNTGAYYAKQMRDLLEAGRIGEIPWSAEYQVHTAWDLGVRDATAIWFFQVDHCGNVNVIDYYMATGEGMTHYFKVLKQKPYSYGSHFGPHDLKQRSFETGRSRLEVALQHGIRFQPVPKLDIADGIEAVRALLPKCRFDAKKCFTGLEALRQYTKEETGMLDMYGKPIYREQPKHDWASDPADAFRYLAIAIESVMGYNGIVDANGEVTQMPDKAIDDWDLFQGI